MATSWVSWLRQGSQLNSLWFFLQIMTCTFILALPRGLFIRFPKVVRAGSKAERELLSYCRLAFPLTWLFAGLAGLAWLLLYLFSRNLYYGRTPAALQTCRESRV